MSTLTGKRKYRVNARFYGNCGFHLGNMKSAARVPLARGLFGKSKLFGFHA